MKNGVIYFYRMLQKQGFVFYVNTNLLIYLTKVWINDLFSRENTQSFWKFGEKNISKCYFLTWTNFNCLTNAQRFLFSMQLVVWICSQVLWYWRLLVTVSVFSAVQLTHFFIRIFIQIPGWLLTKTFLHIPVKKNFNRFVFS